MAKKKNINPNWQQNLVNAQIEIRRAVWATNTQANQSQDIQRSDEEWKAYIKKHAECAVQDLQAGLEQIK